MGCQDRAGGRVDGRGHACLGLDTPWYTSCFRTGGSLKVSFAEVVKGLFNVLI
jgi:hypothetical protein